MARLFDNASSEYLEINQAIVANMPLAMVCWFNTDAALVAQILMGLADKDSINDSHLLYIYKSNGDNTIGAQSWHSPNQGDAVTTASASLNNWHHACAILASATDRRALLNGANKGTNATSVTPVNLDRTSIGRMGRSVPGYYMSGHIAEAAIYDLSQWPGATDSDKADNFEKIVSSLADGFSPLCYPLGLAVYWDLVRGLNDKVGGYNLTASGTIVSAHPRIILPHNLS